MKRKTISFISLSLVGAMTLTGCSTTTDFSKLGYVQELTKQEVIDYYAQQMSYENIVSRASNKVVDLRYNNVPEVMKEALANAVTKTLETHQLNNGYSADMATDMHEYLKIMLDDMVLTNSTIKSMKEAKGYYFVTVESDIAPNQTGTFKNEANYLGIDGVIVEDYTENPVIDQSFLKVALDKVNAYQEAIGKKPFDTYGLDLSYVPETPQAEPETTMPETDLAGNPIIGTDETQPQETEPETSAQDGEGEDETQPETTKAPEVEETQPTYAYEEPEETDKPDDNSYCNSVRKLAYDVNLFNKVAGTAVQSIATTPYLGMVYNPVSTSGDFSGYGIYPQGSYGLKDFGYNRSDYTGKITLVYVFKQNENDRNTLNYKYCYVESYTSNVAMEDKNVVLADFIQTEIEKIFERADRVVNDANVNGLMNQDIFESSDLALRYAMLKKHSNLLTFISHVEKVLDRQNKVYLVELERTTEEAAKGCFSIGKYTDKYYAVVRQVDTEFKINDMVWVSREMARMPEPDIDNSITRRLTSLNLSGEVTEESKASIESMLDMLYRAGTARKAVPKNDGTDGTIGLYDLFDKDRALLSTEKDEYLKSQVVGRLMKHGSDVPCNISGMVEQWLGGYNDQVEFVTEEFYNFPSIQKGVYVHSYYLVNHYGTSWVIDDIQIIEEKEVEGSEYTEMINKFKGQQTTEPVIETTGDTEAQ